MSVLRLLVMIAARGSGFGSAWIILSAPIGFVRSMSFPTLDMWEKINLSGAVGGFHWSYLAQPAPVPEK